MNEVDVSTDAAATSDTKWTMVVTDYQSAVLKLLTLSLDQQLYLVLGYIELYPHDIPVPQSFTFGDKPWTIPKTKGKGRLAASANVMSVRDALDWYEDASRGRSTFASEGRSINFVAAPLGAEPALGLFCVGEEIPFTVPWHGRPRIHRLVPMNELDLSLQRFVKNTDVEKWCRHNFGFNPFDNEDWLGSLSLIAPNPLLGRVEQYIQNHSDAGEERVVVKATRRRYRDYPMNDLLALQLVLLQRRPSGWAEILPTKFDDDGLHTRDYETPLMESGLAIYCQTRGLLHMEPLSFWVTKIEVQIGFVDKIAQVEVPPSGRRKPGKTYTTHRTAVAGRAQAGTRLPVSGASRLAMLKEVRQRRIAAEAAPQFTFGKRSISSEHLPEEEKIKARIDAEELVGSVVSRAKQRVIFVDPDFGLRELQNFALKVTSDNIKIIIITGSRRLRESGETEAQRLVAEANSLRQVTRGEQLLAQVEHLQKTLGDATPSVFVMPNTNDHPVFHDRYLIVDDIAWFVGPSFNELGERIGTMAQLYDSRAVLSLVEQTIDKSLVLSDWIRRLISCDRT